MKIRYGFCVALLTAATAAQAMDITEFSGNNVAITPYYAVYDIKAGDAAAMQSAVLNAVRNWFKDAELSNGIAPSPLPAEPGNMVIAKQGNIQVGRCPGELFSVFAQNRSMMKYGELSATQTCVFPYSGGYRLYYLANYAKRSGIGGGAAVLGAMFANAIGAGDSSQFIFKTLDRLEANIKEIGGEIILVDAAPPIAGKQAAGFSASIPAPANGVPLPPTQVQEAAQPPLPESGLDASRYAHLTPDQRAKLAQLKLAMAQQGIGRSARQPADPVPSSAVRPSASSTDAAIAIPPLQARKELTAIGLNYYDREQLIEAIRRGDEVAVSLFVASKGVDLTAAGKDGKSPVQIARDQATKYPEIEKILRTTAP